MQEATLKTPRLLLRPFTMDDAPDVARLCGDRLIADTTLLIPHPYTLEDAKRWLAMQAESPNATWAIAEAATGELVGCIGLMFDDAHDKAEIGYWIGVPFWGKGYATEAGRAVIAWGFGERKLNRVFASHYRRNPASGKVMQKLGMKPEGVLRQHVKRWGVYEDCVWYGVNRDEYDWAHGAQRA